MKVYKVIIILGYLYCLLFLPLLFIDTLNNQIDNAIVLMSIGLVVCWMGIFGLFSYLVGGKVKPISYKPVLSFILFCILLALFEEGIAVSMTNIVSNVKGVSSDEAYITASTNYFEVVMFHSVVVFIPMFISWGLVLRKYSFHPLAVYVLFGITGTISEALAFGVGSLFNGLMWISVYGLMIYLPAKLVQFNSSIKPKWYFYIVMVFLPILFSLPVVILINLIR